MSEVREHSLAVMNKTEIHELNSPTRSNGSSHIGNDKVQPGIVDRSGHRDGLTWDGMAFQQSPSYAIPQTEWSSASFHVLPLPVPGKKSLIEILNIK
jgi:hypothetical protein